jgi:hypothetical protein
LGLAALVGAEVNVAAEVVANVMDYLSEKLGEIAQDLANSPENPSLPMGTVTDMGEVTDTGEDGEPDGGASGATDGGTDGETDGEGGGGGGDDAGEIHAGEDGTLPVMLE